MGRRAEREAVERVLVRARAGRSGALVVRGEAGIGKTALLEQAREGAGSSGFRVESSVGVQAEAQFAFAGLHQLCSPLLGRLGVARARVLGQVGRERVDVLDQPPEHPSSNSLTPAASSPSAAGTSHGNRGGSACRAPAGTAGRLCALPGPPCRGRVKGRRCDSA